MIVLGIHDGTHDAGAALVVDGRLVAAANEERFTRRKGQGGWPAYVRRMAKHPAAGISIAEQREIVKFLEAHAALRARPAAEETP